jgi:L-fuculose-phosphate aldolase
MFAPFSNRSPEQTNKEDLIFIQPVGFVENQICEPTSPEQIRELESRIVLKHQFIGGTLGLEPGQQILIVFYFHRSNRYELLQHPRGDQRKDKRGVFALRSPNRPNPIGVTAVDLLEITGNILRVRNLDAINGTPVLDIKPA